MITERRYIASKDIRRVAGEASCESWSSFPRRRIRVKINLRATSFPKTYLLLCLSNLQLYDGEIYWSFGAFPEESCSLSIIYQPTGNQTIRKKKSTTRAG